MAKSSRSSIVKKNKAGLKKNVFGPVEQARSERLNAKLLALAQQPKPEKQEMEVEKDAGESDAKHDAQADGTMDVDQATTKKPEKSSSGSVRTSKITKARHRRARNNIVFAPTGRAKSKKRGKR